MRTPHRIPGFVLAIVAVTGFVREKTGWIAPESAKKMKNPIRATKASLQRGKEIYEEKCALGHGEKGDAKGPASTGINPKPTNVTESHGEGTTDGEHFWKTTTGRVMPSFEKDLTGEERWHVVNSINMLLKHE